MTVSLKGAEQGSDTCLHRVTCFRWRPLARGHAVQADGGFGGTLQDALEFKVQLHAFHPPAGFGTAGEEAGVEVGEEGGLGLGRGHAGRFVGQYGHEGGVHGHVFGAVNMGDVVW